MWLLLHFMAQAPQLLGSVSNRVSQPLTPLPSQLPKPELQVGLQIPALQEVAEAFWLLHELLQAPQLAVLVLVSVSQPLPALPSQLPRPGLQAATPHSPPSHLAVPFGVEQVVPQAPQFWGSSARLSQLVPPHCVWPGAHTKVASGLYGSTRMVTKIPCAGLSAGFAQAGLPGSR